MCFKYLIWVFFISEVFIVGAKRTPFGAYGGTLKDKSSIELGEIAAKAAIKSANVNPEFVNSVVIGNVIQVWIIYLSNVGTVIKDDASYNFIPLMLKIHL